MPQIVDKHTIRHKDGGTITIEHMNRSTAIKCMCSECMGFEEDVMGCTDVKCPLFPFRKRTLLNRSRKTEPEVDNDESAD